MIMSKVDASGISPERKKIRVPDQEELTAAQQELLRDMRTSLAQIRRGDLLPARESLREVRTELEAEDNANRSDS